MSSIHRQIVKRIEQEGRGKVIFSSDFISISNTENIKKVLLRLEQKERLVRLSRGIYLYPKLDKELGILQPSIEDIAKAIAKRDRARIVPTGVLALNKLGLSTQVPMKVVYLTDGAPRSIQLGKHSIKFKKTTPKNLMARGEISSLVIQALREIGKDNATEEQLTRIHDLLLKEDTENIFHDSQVAPVWIARILMRSIETM